MQENIKNTDMQDDLLTRYLLGEASPEEIEQVERWRKTDGACNKRFEEFRLLWETSKGLMNIQADDAQASLSRFRENAKARNNHNTRMIRLKKQRSWIAIAASILLIAGGGWFYKLNYTVTNLQLITQGETRTTNLADGSVITLNRMSLFEYPSAFKGNQRLVQLKSGEAFFNIAHDKSKPFIISTGNILIKVVGTSFNVKNKKGDLEVIVESGIVKISRDGQAINLRRGEKAIIKTTSATLQKERNTDQLYTYYRSKEFVAEDTPLWRVVEVLNEAYDSHIVIERKDLYNLPLNTTFKNESLDKILDVISRTFKITVEKRHKAIILK